MKKGLIIGIIIALVIILGAVIFLNSSTDKTNNNSNNLIIKEPENQEEISENVIEITSTGFNPATLEVKLGDTVTFVNKDNQAHWPASAMHPTHTVYPGSDIEKCGTADDNNIFDSCKGIRQSEEYKFTFNEKGSWGYHDHLAAGLRGKIIVN